MELPGVGLGTLGLNESCEESVAVYSGAGIGGTLIDTAEHYGNLKLVGAGLSRAAADGAKPFLVLKISGLPVGEYATVRARVEKMLGELGVEKGGLLLMHWPGLVLDFDPTDMSPLEDSAAFQGKVTSFEDFCDNIAAAWANMLQLKADGLVDEIGTSNFYQFHLEELKKRCDGAVPYANEIFIDPTNQENEFVAAMQADGIRVLAYRALAYRSFAMVEDVVARLGEGVSKQSVVLAWLLKRGIWPLVKCRGSHIDDNVNGSFKLQSQLTDEDMEAFKKFDTGLTKFSSEWFAKFWRFHNEAKGVSEDDVQMLVGMGVDEAKARECLEKCGGNLDAAMESAFS